MCSQSIFILTFNSAVKVFLMGLGGSIRRLYQIDTLSDVYPMAKAKLYLNSE